MHVVVDFVYGIAKWFTRVIAQVRKELIQVRRRPGAFFSLVLGPFLIALVVPPDSQLPTSQQDLQGVLGPAVNLVSVSPDAAAAEAQLQKLEVDAVVIIPSGVEQTFRSGKQAVITVQINQIDPANAAYADFIVGTVISQVNQEILKRAIAEGEAYAISQGADPPVNIPPEVIAAPTTANVVNLAPVEPSVISFFAPAVLALVLQHMAVTLTALSFVRERLSGTMDVFRVSPVNALELVLGKYLGLGLVSALIATVTTLALVLLLNVPLLGSPWMVALIVFLLVFASLGAGLLISVVSDSERQAVQLSLLLLLAAVFFSGFVLPVHEFAWFLQVVAYALPVTHGITLLQDEMLRGTIVGWWQMGVLAGIGLVLLVLTAILLRRQLRQA
jgi:ABC-2 type transport system permease protein